MRTLMLIALLATALLAGCDSQNATAPQPQAVEKIADHVSGRVMLREPRALSSDARLEVRVVDVANPGLVLAQTVVSPANQPPVSFDLPIDTSAFVCDCGAVYPIREA